MRGEGSGCPQVVLSQIATLTIVDLATEQPPNLVVQDLQAANGFVTVHQPILLRATVANRGFDPMGGGTVELLVDGRGVAQQEVHLPSGSTQNVEFLYRFAQAGDHRVEVRLPPDALPLDNRRFLAVSAQPAIRTLCVSGLDRSARYVQLCCNRIPPWPAPWR